MFSGTSPLSCSNFVQPQRAITNSKLLPKWDIQNKFSLVPEKQVIHSLFQLYVLCVLETEIVGKHNVNLRAEQLCTATQWTGWIIKAGQ